MDDPDTLINRIFDHVENGDVDKAVFVCVRLSRYIGDHFNTVMFLRELRVDQNQFKQQFAHEVRALSEHELKHVWQKTGDSWLEEHTMDFPIFLDAPDNKVLALGVGEMQDELHRIEKKIADMQPPQGMNPFDTAAFTDRYDQQKLLLRARADAVVKVRERIRTRSMDYASRVEAQRRAAKKTVEFLATVQTSVGNYFAAHHVDTYTKLQKASELAESTNPEDHALLLTAVRRAIKSIADHFLPPSNETHTFPDGKIGSLDDDHYLNRLSVFCSRFPSSSSSDLIKAELEHLSFFARRLNSIASKGVHADVTHAEARQGLVGLYLFASNVIGRLEQK